ncbi:MAG: DNA repair protein RecN, partial [Acidimicrobiia bacterium]|nr:DNA repair protein RecN [Acidimicrobiia bacterium]
TESLAAAAVGIDDEGGAGDVLRTALGHLESAARVDATLHDHATRLRALLTDLDDLGRDLRGAADSIDHDPAVHAAAEERAAVLAGLRRKYGATVDEVIAYGAEAEERAANLERIAARAETIAADIAAAEQSALVTGEALAAARRIAGKHLADEALEYLRQLGFREPVLVIEVESSPPGPHGADRVRLLFASDAGLTPGPVSRVASGGELSRLVLAIRVAAGVADADVVAFDEIDAGIGGATALAMGELLARLAVDRQVLVVTHLPQVAAFADTQFVVERVGREAAVRSVQGDDRIAEVARMLGGIGESDSGRNHAAELLALAAQRAHPGGGDTDRSLRDRTEP